MKIDVSVNKVALTEIDAAFDRLTKAIATKIVRKALREGTKRLAALVAEALPRDTGASAEAVKVRAPESKRKGVIALVVRVGESAKVRAGGRKRKQVNTYYAQYPELGTIDQPAQHTLRETRDLWGDDVALDVARRVAAAVEAEVAAIAAPQPHRGK